MQNFIILSTLSIVILGLFVFADVNFSEAVPPVPEYRDVTGNGNNVNNLLWGNAGENLIRDLTDQTNDVALSDYGDGKSTPAGMTRPSARAISNAIFSQISSVPDPNGTTDLFWVWGQFVDHDIDLTGGATPAEPFDIPVPIGDPVFDPFNTGMQVISLSRSLYDVSTGIGPGPGNPRQQINEITSYIDAGTIYGSDIQRANNLRDLGNNGKLKLDFNLDARGLLPLNTVGEENANANPMIQPDDLFLAGDVRANEQAALTALHTLFVREHNRLAVELEANNLLCNDEKIYQEAKLIVEGELQWITYNEFLPVLLGPTFTPDPWVAYDPLIKAQIANEFSTEAYRYGHDAISSEVERLSLLDGSEFIDGNGIGHLSLVQAFFNPNWIKQDGIDEILLGVSLSPGEKIDHLMVDELRNLLFGPPGSPGLDLAALDIQRGRDHGTPDYNTVRVAYGLAPVVLFSDITSDVALQVALENLYGNVDNVDLWVGGLAEEPANGSMLGELFSTMIEFQFEMIRDGDRYWYQNRDLSEEQLNIIENSYLSDIIMRNTEISSMQNNVFVMPSSVVGGHMIPVDTTTLILAGAQYTAVWLIPVLVSAIGFGIVILRKY